MYRSAEDKTYYNECWEVVSTHVQGFTKWLQDLFEFDPDSPLLDQYYQEGTNAVRVRLSYIAFCNADQCGSSVREWRTLGPKTRPRHSSFIGTQIRKPMSLMLRLNALR